MTDFKQMQSDSYAAGTACREWVDEHECAVIDLEKDIFIEAFKRGLNHERKKWQKKFKWHNPLEKPEPDSYIIAAEELGNGEYEFIVGTYIDDARPWISNGQNCRMWRCIDLWCYVSDFSRTIPKVQR